MVPGAIRGTTATTSEMMSARMRLALRGGGDGLSIEFADGRQFRYGGGADTPAGLSMSNDLRFGLWVSMAEDKLTDTRNQALWNGNTDTTNVGFDLGFDLSPQTSMVVGLAQTTSSTSGLYETATSTRGTMRLDSDSTSLYAGFNLAWLDVWLANGKGNSRLYDSNRQDPRNTGFNYSSVGLRATFDVSARFQIGAEVEQVVSDLSIGRDSDISGLVSHASQQRGSVQLSYEIGLGEFDSRLKQQQRLVPKLKMGYRDLSTGVSSLSSSAASGLAVETGFGLDYTHSGIGLTVSLNTRSVAVENYSAESTQWLIRWQRGRGGEGLAFSLQPLVSGSLQRLESLTDASLLDATGLNSASSEGVRMRMEYGVSHYSDLVRPYVQMDVDERTGAGLTSLAVGTKYPRRSGSGVGYVRFPTSCGSQRGVVRRERRPYAIVTAWHRKYGQTDRPPQLLSLLQYRPPCGGRMGLEKGGLSGCDL